MLSFSLDTSPKSFSPLVNRLVDNCLFKVSPDRHQALLQLDQDAYCFLVHALLQQPKSCNRPGWGLECSATTIKSGEMKSGVSWRKNSTVERARWAGALSCYGVTVAIATAQMVLGLYQTFQSQSVGNWMKYLSVKNYRWTICFGEVMTTYGRRPVF